MASLVLSVLAHAGHRPDPAIAKNVNPVTSSQSWCSTRPKERAVVRTPASTAAPVRLRSTMLDGRTENQLDFFRRLAAGHQEVVGRSIISRF